MPFDSFVLGAIAREIKEKIIETGARLNKVYQLNPTDLLLYFKTGSKAKTLFFSIDTQKARIHFTEHHYNHPPTPPPFCMLMRKHLSNGELVSLEQPLLERAIYLNFAVFNEKGEKVIKTLAAEIMGRHSNLILLDSPDENNKRKITGVLKPIPPFRNRVRTLLPNHIYLPPPAQEKLHPLALDFEHFSQEMARLQNQPTARALLRNLQGLSPFLAKEIAARAESSNISSEAVKLLWQKLQEILDVYTGEKWEPTLLYDEMKNPIDFSAVNPKQTIGDHRRTSASMSDILDEFYEYTEKKEEKQNLTALLFRQTKQALEKTQKRKRPAKELDAAGKAEYYLHCGELILMNLKIPLRSRKIELNNILSEQSEKIKIALDPQLSPSSNAQRYFKKYRRARQAEKKIAERLKQTRREIAYLDNVLFSLQKSDLQSLKEIKDELEETGYLPVAKKSRHPKKGVSFNFLKFSSSEGEEIFVGRNNRQNEYLVQNFAAKSHLWLHVKEMPGAHVIVRSTCPHESTIKEAALLAAHFSRGARSSNVPVDYTTVKNVRRLPGGKPGMVTYNNYKTLYVTPDEKNMGYLLKQHHLETD